MRVLGPAALLLAAGMLLAGCSTGDDDDHGPRPDDDSAAGDDDSGIPTDDDDTTTADDDDTAPPGPCPAEMVLVEHEALRFCIDRWEGVCDEVLAEGGTQPWSPYQAVDDVDVVARSEGGVVPQGYISGDQAAAACAAAGKRLCTSEEWLLACQGPQVLTWPYGASAQPGVCNDDYPSHPVIDYFGTSDTWVWTYESMNDPGINQMDGTVAPTGEHSGCVSAFGVFDLVGNLHEWVEDVDGTFRGGFYVDVELNGPGCTYRTTAHDRGYHDYSTGFRCCGEPQR